MRAVATLALGKPRSRHTRCANPALGTEPTQGCEGGGREGENPKIHCNTATNLLGVFVQRQAIPMVYDTPKRAEGFGP